MSYTLFGDSYRFFDYPPFIALDASNVIAIDLRRYKHNIREACEEYEPDIVILAYNPSAFSDKQFDFFK